MVSCIWLAPAWSWRSASGRAGRNMCMASVPTMVTITSSHSGAFRLAAVRPWAGDSEECSAVISGSLLVGQVRVAGGLGGHGLQQALQRGVGRAQFLGRHGAQHLGARLLKQALHGFYLGMAGWRELGFFYAAGKISSRPIGRGHRWNPVTG